MASFKDVSLAGLQRQASAAAAASAAASMPATTASGLINSATLSGVTASPLSAASLAAALQAAAELPPVTDAPFRAVQLEALVVMRIIRHHRQAHPATVTGQLLGLEGPGLLEVTNCFPFPTQIATDDEEAETNQGAGAEYQLEMMRCLREVNVDHNAVGWYTTATMGKFLSPSFVETQFNYQKNIPQSVVVVYDPLRSTHGSLSLRAFRFTPEFMEIYRSKKIKSMESVESSKFPHSQILEELPVEIHNQLLVNAMLMELEEATFASEPLAPNFDTLDLSYEQYLAKNLDLLSEAVDDHLAEMNRLQYYQRSLARQQQSIAAYLKNREEENRMRAAAGEEPLPEEDINSVFKPLQEPSRLDLLLLSHQIDTYCQQINQVAGAAFPKLYFSAELQK